MGQDQAGVVYALPFGDGHQMRVMGYGGRRDVEQFLDVVGRDVALFLKLRDR